MDETKRDVRSTSLRRSGCGHGFSDACGADCRTGRIPLVCNGGNRPGVLTIHPQQKARKLFAEVSGFLNRQHLTNDPICSKIESGKNKPEFDGRKFL